jgi:hypothetical protein
MALSASNNLAAFVHRRDAHARHEPWGQTIEESDEARKSFPASRLGVRQDTHSRQ